MQVPVVTKVTVLADIVQTELVSELNETAKPELAVALTVNGTLPIVLSASAAKVIVWLALLMTT
ncbi:MAG: hypothetical protein ING68_14760, partial [Rhodocyclaceae bacterium]|nr:hypothetical protein [Rhodocyclaceae bacterium]